MTHTIYSIHNFGFTNNRSTSTNLLYVENIIIDVTNNKEPYDILTFDFSRAFDRVPHHLLLKELARRGITRVALRWIKSFLSDRTQSVRVNGSISHPTVVTPGVIQGYTLGLTLYTIFMDPSLVTLDIPANGYADDLKFVVSLTSHNHSIIQINVQRVYEWSVLMEMPLSVDKCLEVYCGANNPKHYYQCGTLDLPKTESIVDLGVTRSYSL